MTGGVDPALAAAVTAAVMARGCDGRRHAGKLIFRCPAHDDDHPSAYWHPDEHVWGCHCGARGGALDLARRLGVAVPARRPDPRPPVARYEIRTAAGELVAIHCRRGSGPGKQLWWERPDGAHGLGGRSVAALPLYGTERLAGWPADAPVVVVEGEKAAAALLTAGIPALGTVTGAAVTPGDAALAVLRGRAVVLWPDADADGRRHMTRIGSALAGVARRCAWFDWPGAPPKGDAADYLAQHPDAAALRAALAAAPAWSPPGDGAPGSGARPEAGAETGPDPGARDERSAADAGGPAGAVARPATLIRLDEVEPEHVRWLWPGRLPRAKLTILDGDPGLGKSTLLLEVAARISRGQPLPDGAGPAPAPAGVVILSAEDGLADTIRPRLAAAGADLARIAALTAVTDGDGARPPELPLDLDALRQAIEEVQAALVIVDPLVAYLGGATNAWRDQDVRRALAPLAALAEETGAAIVAVRHLNKLPGANPLYRGGGSIGIIGAARVGLLVAPDPEDADRRILAVVKNNLAPLAPALAFRLVAAAPGAVAHVEWLGATAHTAAALLAQPAGDEERGALAEARAFLAALLAAGRQPAREVQAEARRAGISDRTLNRAKAALGITSARGGYGKDGVWYWALPAAPAIDCQAGHRLPSSEYGNLWRPMAIYGDAPAPVSNGHASTAASPPPPAANGHAPAPAVACAVCGGGPAIARAGADGRPLCLACVTRPLPALAARAERSA
jgi:hypothetical protein